MACDAQHNSIRVAGSCRTILGRASINADVCLGCGAYGCVFPAGENRVAKLFDTARPGGLAEYKASKILAQIGSLNRHSALPIIHGIYRLPKTCLRRHSRARDDLKFGVQIGWAAVVVVREDLADIDAAGGDFSSGSDALIQLEDAVYDPRPGYLKDILAYWRQELKSADVLSVFETALDLHRWAKRNNLMFSDTHMANWGVRSNGQFVLRDLGFTSDASGKELPKAQGKVPVLSGLADLRRRPICLHGLHRTRRR